MMCSRDSIQPVQPARSLWLPGGKSIANQTTVCASLTRASGYRVPAPKHQISARCDTSCARKLVFTMLWICDSLFRACQPCATYQGRIYGQVRRSGWLQTPQAQGSCQRKRWCGSKEQSRPILPNSVQIPFICKDCSLDRITCPLVVGIYSFAIE